MRHDGNYCRECKAWPVTIERVTGGEFKCLNCWALYTEAEAKALPKKPSRRSIDDAKWEGKNAGPTKV